MDTFRSDSTWRKKLCKIRLLTLPVIFLLILPVILLQDYAAGKFRNKNKTAMHLQNDNGPLPGAVVFINALDDWQRKKAQFEFDDSSRTRWHYLPAASFSRPGISLAELNEKQKELLFSMLQEFLSHSGYNKTKQIISLEEVLVELGGSPRLRDREQYFTAFYGNPVKDSLWSWSFQGHHISLNFTVSDNLISMTPRFLGANPATVPRGKRKGLRTLDREEDYGLELINSMTEKQREQAIFSSNTFYDITTTNAVEVNPPELAGIKMKDLNDSQRQILLNLIDEYLSAMPGELALKRMENLKKEEFDEIRFGWAGATKAGVAHYYRIQGKTFLVEFDNSQNGANHIHTVWRDFDGDFGRDLIRDHYRSSSHHHSHD